MTNGEKIQESFPDLEIIHTIKDCYEILLQPKMALSPLMTVFVSWWNAEYEKNYFNVAIEYDDGNRTHSIYTSGIPTIVEADKDETDN